MATQLNLFDIVNQPFMAISTDLFPDSESDEVEFKSAKGGFPKDFWKTYSAFANSNGGVIVLGVSERKGVFVFDGLTQDLIVKYQKEFWNNVNNRNSASINLLSNDDVKSVDVNGKEVLAFNIPAAERKNKPVYLTLNPFKNTYKRNYEGDYICKDEEVRRMLADADLSFSPDSRILEGFSLTDIDLFSLKQYRQIFASIRPSHPWLSMEDKEFLEQLGGYRKDRKTSKEGLTVAGMLMFGKFLSITDEECCPKFFPDYREVLSDNEDTRWTDRIYPDGTWESNLFQFYKLVYPKLSSRLPKPFQLVKGQRLEDTAAHAALREAFVNSLIHTDYSAPGSIVIKSTSNSFSFTNPGTLLVTIAQFYKGGISQCRNTNLQKMFLMIGSAEKAGSGVNKILSGWSSSHWRRPYVTVENEPDRIILEMPMFSIIPEDTLHDLKNLFGYNVETLGKDELTALAICHIEGDITNTRLQYVVDKHKTEITKMLQDLCKNGYLISENKSRWTTYRLNTDIVVDGKYVNEVNSTTGSLNRFVDDSIQDLPTVDLKHLPDDVEDGSIMDNSNMDSSNMDSSNMDNSNMDSSNMDSSIMNSPNMDSSSMDSFSMDSSTVNTSSYNSTRDIFSISKADSIKKRYTYHEIAKEIIKICSMEYKAAATIAKEVNRSEKYLKNNIFPKMIHEEKLLKLHPDNHPDQKYMAKDK
ncbi:RNA-binding domain-containing protein [Flavobacterium sp. SM2513]|uniref:RNA-binding domain-containing protein n=1 Tax=Flavobacterium sp. SM2513 TaxID=3424766 RepID=UPI003D7F9C28